MWKVTTGPEYFPSAESNWKKYGAKLAQEEKSATDHKEEVPPDTMNKIYMLLKNTQEAMKHKVSGDYVSTYITTIPTELHNHLPKIMMLGATMILVF